MLRFHIVSLFPSFFASALQTGLMERALEKGLISVDFTDPRAFTRDRHRHVDDRPYGGGPGMVMQIDPVARALRSLPHPGRMLCMAPNGRPASQKLMRELALEEDITIVCGRYEGFDARLFRLFPLEPLAVGDIVLNGGETAALAILEAVSRLVPGFMGKEASGDEESFSAGLLEYPHFTRPPLYEGLAIPEILSEGNHADIARWRKEQALATTLARRPELLDEAELTEEDVRTLQGLGRTGLGRSISLCLLRQKEDRRARWERKIYASLDEAGLDACLDLARIFSLNAVLVADEQGHEGTAASLEQQMQALTRHYGERPLLLAVAPWPRKKTTLSAVQIRSLARSRPVVLLAGALGYLPKSVLGVCDGFVRPVHCLKSGSSSSSSLDARTQLVMLLDRILGDLC